MCGCRTSRLRNALLLVGSLLSVACGAPGPVAETPPAARPHPAGMLGHRAPADGAFRLQVEPTRILLDDAVVELLVPGELRKIDSLYEALDRRRSARGESFELSIADGVRGAEAMSVVMTAAFAGFPRATLSGIGQEQSGAVTLRAPVPSPPGSKHPELRWPEAGLVMIVRRESVELWRVSRDGTEPPQSVASANRAEVASVLRPVVASECTARAPCPAVLLAVAHDADFALVRVAIESLSRPVTLVVSTATLPAPGEVPELRLVDIGTAGRLPPEQIQKIVRKSYAELRRCYEQGVARSADLEGRVVAKFVIGRDGTVEQVEVFQGTTLSDPDVVACVLAEYRKLVFPKPDGGVVTVVYPIHFAPE